MIKIIIGAVAGYVLGSKAGRERYEKIRKMSAEVANKPAAQQAINAVQAKVPAMLRGKKPLHAAPEPDQSDVYVDGDPSIPGD